MHAPFSFTTVDGSGLQLAAVPVGGADTISIVFSEDVNIQSDYLTLTGLRTANRPVVADFAYDINTMTASWRFMNLTANDSYVISLSDAVTDIEGNNLDGEWVNPATIATTNSLVSVFPSGDGDAGGRFNFVFTLLAGDANLNAYVTFDDFQLMYVNYGVTMGMLFADGDFNGDGAVSFDDYQLFSTNYGLNLQSAWMLADLNADNAVDQSDIDLLVDNLGMSNPDWADGDLNSDGLVDGSDLDLAFAQFGIEVSLVS